MVAKDPHAFLQKRDSFYRPAEERIKDNDPIHACPELPVLQAISDRCTSCGVPFCSGSYPVLGKELSVGCPGGKNIPDWIEAYHRWVASERTNRKALEQAYRLLTTLPLPGWTGRVCPEPCGVGSCVHAQEGHSGGVNIRLIEREIHNDARSVGIDMARRTGPPSGKKVAVVGSGPAGYTAAWFLAQYGHSVTMYEAAARLGGLGRYGIPHWELPRWVVNEDFKLLARLGVEFVTGTTVGRELDVETFYEQYDAIMLCTGARKPRALGLEGESRTEGIHFAMELLTENDRRLEGDTFETKIDVKGRRVMFVGLGYTAQDGLATCGRNGAREVHLVHRHPKPEEARLGDNPWPQWPKTRQTFEGYAYQEFSTTGLLHEHLSATATRLLAENGVLRGVEISTAEKQSDGSFLLSNPREIPVDLLFISAGFTVEFGLLKPLTERPNVAVAGDAALGASFVINAIESARRESERVHQLLSS